MPKLKRFLRAHWGELIFMGSGFGTWLQLFLWPESQRGHYRVFTGAGEYLWRGLNPYGVSFAGTTSGNWLYSVPCGWLYGLFAKLPETLGIALFTAISVISLGFGMQSSLNALEFKGLKIPGWLRQAFWLVTTSELIGGILSNKLEVLMVGLLLISSAWLIRARQVWLAGFIFGTLLDWKFQPAPIFLLLSAHAILHGREYRFFVSGLLSLALWHWLPRLVYGQALVNEMSLARGETLLLQLQEFHQFDHLFHFVERLSGVSFGFSEVTVLSLGIGAGLGLFYLLWACRTQRARADGLNYWLGFSLAWAIGGFFMNALSPLSQASAYILMTPLWLALVVAISLRPEDRQRRAAIWGFVCWNWVSLMFSDFYPKAVRLWAVDWSTKSVGVLATFALVLALLFAENRQRPHTALEQLKMKRTVAS